MIYGITASGTAPAQIAPAGSISFADFVRGHYVYNGGTIIAAAFIDRTDWIGASGLAIPGSAAAGAEIIHTETGTLLATCQWTTVIETEILTVGSGPSNRSFLLTVQNAGGAYFIQISFGNEWEGTAGDGNGYPFAYDDVNSISTGVHKFAATRIDNKISISVDGYSVQSDTTACVLPVGGFPMVNFFLGGWSDSTTKAVNIRSIAFYDPQDDADLPGLSA